MEKTLYRSRKNRGIAGVCGGLGEYLGIDPTIVRLVWAFSVLFGGFGLFAYVVAWIIIPQEKGKEVKKVSQKELKKRVESLAENDGRLIGGIILISIGLVFLLGNYGFFSWFKWRVMWPWVMIALGAALFIVPKERQHG